MYIVFDIGGTKMRLGSSRDGESLDKTMVLDTPATYERGMSRLKQAVQILREGESVDALAGGIAGVFDSRKSALVGSPNLGPWVGKAFLPELQVYFNAPVYVANDAAMAGLGEATRGGGKGFKIVAYITVSTGVGGARIVNGKIDENSVGFEPGHQIIDADRTLIPEAEGIFLGDLISGKALSKRTNREPKEIEERAIWNGLAKILAYGLNNICVFWSPDAIVLGGSMVTGDPAIPIDKVRGYLGKIMKIYPELPVISKSCLGDFGGLHGALEYLKTIKPEYRP